MSEKSRGIVLMTTVTLLTIAPRLVDAQERVERNIVYGMYSGLALLMDVHRPLEPNGIGIIFIAGSGWHTPLNEDADQLKERIFGRHMPREALLEAGYTLFSIDHRAAPRFRYPAAVDDAQRAVRFIRHNAQTYGIDPGKIGALGESSGGHLVNMLGTLDGGGNPGDTSPVNRESAKVQAVVAIYAPSDFVSYATGSDGARDVVSSFLGAPYPQNVDAYPDTAQLYLDASPIAHVSPDDPPFLLIHGDADQVVPFQQSELFRAALARTGLEVSMIAVEGGIHGPGLIDAFSAPSAMFQPVVEWFDRHLRQSR